MRRWILGIILFIAVERFCYYQTGTFSLSKMIYKGSPPSPTSTSSSIELQQPLRFLGAGKQFYAFETSDGNYVLKFMKWSRRRPLPFLSKSALEKRARMAASIQKSSLLALHQLPHETQLVIPQPPLTFTLIDKLGISHTVSPQETHYYVQRKADSFTSYFNSHPEDAKQLLASFIHTVATQCRQGISNLDPIVDRNYGIVDGKVVLLDIGSFLENPKLKNNATIHYEIVLELLPLRAYLQKYHPKHVSTFDALLLEKLQS